MGREIYIISNKDFAHGYISNNFSWSEVFINALNLISLATMHNYFFWELSKMILPYFPRQFPSYLFIQCFPPLTFYMARLSCFPSSDRFRSHLRCFVQCVRSKKMYYKIFQFLPESFQQNRSPNPTAIIEQTAWLLWPSYSPPVGLGYKVIPSIKEGKGSLCRHCSEGGHYSVFFWGETCFFSLSEAFHFEYLTP